MTDIPAPLTLRVELDQRGYDIVIGRDLLDRAADWLVPVLGRRKRLVVISDDTVAPLHLHRLRQGVAAAGIAVDAVIVPPGESSKSWDGLARLIDRLLELKVDRGTLLVALGGGVVGDLAGFAAAITMRGVDFVQVPTTLLAQVDSSVGGKTGINTKAGKNLVGAFHQPRLVLADLTCLTTLPRRELAAGYAEMVKHAVINDAGFLPWLEAHGAALLAGDTSALARGVEHSCRTKSTIVAQDEREGGVRALLNLGHTFGHALEAETGFSNALLHGEAVALGMVLAARYSEAAGLAPAGGADRLAAHLAACGLPTRLSDVPGAPFDPARLVAHMALDKKTKDGRLTFILLRGLGQAFIADDVPADAIHDFLTGIG